MNNCLDFLFYNKAKERFYEWADSKIDLSFLIRFHAIYVDPFVSKAALTRIIRCWAAKHDHVVFTHTSILDFSDKRNKSSARNIIHLVWIPIEGWKYFNSVRDFAVEKFLCSKIIFLPICDKVNEKLLVSNIKPGVFTYHPQILPDKKFFENDPISNDYGKTISILHFIYNFYLKGCQVFLVELDENSPENYEYHIEKVGSYLRNRSVRPVFIEVSNSDIYSIDLSLIERSDKNQIFIICIDIENNIYPDKITWNDVFIFEKTLVYMNIDFRTVPLNNILNDQK